MRIPRLHNTSAIVLLAMAVGIAASAQYNNQQKVLKNGADDMTLNAQLVRTGLYLFSSTGSNTLLRLSAAGLVLVDGQPAANYDILRARVRKISDQPIRALILTDHYASHTGSDAKFLSDGTRIIAQENVKRNLVSCDPPGGVIVPPSMTYDGEYMLRLGGVEAQLLHFGNARTSGDTVVYFPNLKVVAVGDLFSATPSPDFSAGGSLVDWGPVLEQVLKLDFDLVVPGTGPIANRADLEAFKAKIDTLVIRAAGLVKKGVPKDQMMAQLKTDDLGWQLSFTAAQIDGFYAELRRKSKMSSLNPQQL
jgi:cyclase